MPVTIVGINSWPYCERYVEKGVITWSCVCVFLTLVEPRRGLHSCSLNVYIYLGISYISIYISIYLVL